MNRQTNVNRALEIIEDKLQHVMTAELEWSGTDRKTFDEIVANITVYARRKYGE